MAEAAAQRPSSVDADRTARFAVHFAGVKQAAEFFGHRRRRFALLPDSHQLKAGEKRVHLMRHGEGEHNVFRAAEFVAGRTPHAKRDNIREVPAGLHDPGLTAKGREEAMGTRAAAQRHAPELLVTSPLRRAVQTLHLAFKDSVDKGVPIVAHELCREAFHATNPSIYDSRKSRTALAQEFPSVDFSRFVIPEVWEPAEEEEAGNPARGTKRGRVDDPLWWHCGSVMGTCEGETREVAMVENAYGFLCWLMSRPETEIAVATHSLWLLALYHGSLDPRGGGVHEKPVSFSTGELRSVVIAEREAAEGVGASLARWKDGLLGDGVAQEEMIKG